MALLTVTLGPLSIGLIIGFVIVALEGLWVWLALRNRKP